MRHGKIKKRLLAVAVILLVLAAVLVITDLVREKKTDGNVLADLGRKKETIVLWYTDDALTDYLNNKALDFYEQNGIRVETELVSGLEYLEQINKASVYGEDKAPDVYIVSNDSLEKAYLSGLAAELTDLSFVSGENGFNQAAINAVTYNGKIVGCPFYFETSALLYNKTYLDQIAQTVAETADNANASTEEELLEAENAEAAQLITAEDLIPSSIADILEFADSYSAPENVEYFFRWDVSDIFYNYFFIGNYISVGGASGDDKNLIDI